MNKLSKDKRDKIILVVIGTLAAVAGIWFAIIKTQLTSHQEAKRILAEVEAKLTRGNATLKAADATQQQLVTLTAELKKCESGMAVPNDMYSWFFQTMNTFRAGYQVDIPQFSRETPAEVGIFPNFPYRAALFTVRGAAYYHDFGKFMADLENEHPYLRVQGVEIEPAVDPSAAGGAGEKLSFKMDLLTLVRPTQ